MELHAYQKDFLDTMGAEGTNGASNASEALESIVAKAMSDKATYKAIFDEFHCIHCGSKSPADWIANRKGKKDPYSFSLKEETKAFLNGTIVVAVGPPGPNKALQPDKPKRADSNKAARCCVDWAIKAYGGVANGKPNAKAA